MEFLYFFRWYTELGAHINGDQIEIKLINLESSAYVSILIEEPSMTIDQHHSHCSNIKDSRTSKSTVLGLIVFIDKYIVLNDPA